jgi:hypothetical protein
MTTRVVEKGSALIVALVVTLVVAGLSGSYLGLSVYRQGSTFREVDRERALYAAEAALAQSMHELNTDFDYDGSGGLMGTVTAMTAIPGYSTAVSVDTTGLTGDKKRLTAICTFGPANKRVDRSLEVIVDTNKSLVTSLGMAAVISRDPMDFKGNINVDGRDWDINGSAVVGAGVDGVVSGGAVTVTGSAGVGGNGLPPPGSGAAPGSVDANHDWDSDGLDNDREGTVDQPGETYPVDPDQALGLPNGTLMLTAKKMGTYFTTQAGYSAAIAANGGQALGGKVVYCDFAPSPPFELGTGLNANPSILIVHNSTSNAIAKNVHGDFKGLFMADKIEGINAGTKIVGMVQSWGQFGNLFGAGNSDVLFSSAVLANLPQVQTEPYYLFRAWREVVR